MWGNLRGATADVWVYARMKSIDTPRHAAPTLSGQIQYKS